MKDFRSTLLPAAALVSLLSLAACGGNQTKAEKPDTSGPDLPATLTLAPLQNCPQTAILQQAQQMTLFLPGRSDIAALVSTARMQGLSGACTFNKKHQALAVQFSVNFVANNGPANAGSPVTLPWFVAITDGDHIIEKHTYTVTLTFDGNMSVATTSSKPVKIELPDVPKSAQLEILTGFQMTPAQLAYAAAHPNGLMLP